VRSTKSNNARAFGSIDLSRAATNQEFSGPEAAHDRAAEERYDNVIQRQTDRTKPTNGRAFVYLRVNESLRDADYRHSSSLISFFEEWVLESAHQGRLADRSQPWFNGKKQAPLIR